MLSFWHMEKYFFKFQILFFITRRQEGRTQPSMKEWKFFNRRKHFLSIQSVNKNIKMQRKTRLYFIPWTNGIKIEFEGSRIDWESTKQFYFIIHFSILVCFFLSSIKSLSCLYVLELSCLAIKTTFIISKVSFELSVEII